MAYENAIVCLENEGLRRVHEILSQRRGTKKKQLKGGVSLNFTRCRRSKGSNRCDTAVTERKCVRIVVESRGSKLVHGAVGSAARLAIMYEPVK